MFLHAAPCWTTFETTHGSATTSGASSTTEAFCGRAKGGGTIAPIPPFTRRRALTRTPSRPTKKRCVNCVFCIFRVQYRACRFPYPKKHRVLVPSEQEPVHVPWWLHLVPWSTYLPCPVPKIPCTYRDGSNPYCDLPCLRRPVQIKPVQSRDGSISREIYPSLPAKSIPRKTLTFGTRYLVQYKTAMIYYIPPGYLHEIRKFGGRYTAVSAERTHSLNEKIRWYCQGDKKFGSRYTAVSVERTHSQIRNSLIFPEK